MALKMSGVYPREFCDVLVGLYVQHRASALLFTEAVIVVLRLMNAEVVLLALFRPGIWATRPESAAWTRLPEGSGQSKLAHLIYPDPYVYTTLTIQSLKDPELWARVLASQIFKRTDHEGIYYYISPKAYSDGYRYRSIL